MIQIAACQYSYKMVRVVTMMRGGLVSLVYARSMRLDPTDQAKAGAALTLMSADVELIAGGAGSLHEIWAAPIEIGVGIWLVERQLGVACLIPVVVAIRTYLVVSSYLPCHYSSIHFYTPLPISALIKSLSPFNMPKET